MNVDDGIGTAIGAGVQARKQLKASKDEQHRLQQERERQLWTQQQLDYKPELASNHIGPYQRSQAPVADAFLNSFLTGDNSSAVQSTRNGAPAQRAAADQRFQQNYGGWDQLRQQQTAQNQSTPWDIKPITREISKPDVSLKQFQAEQTGFLDKEQLKALEAAGFGFKDGRYRNKNSGHDAQALMKALGLDTEAAGDGQNVLRGVADQLNSGKSWKEIQGDLHPKRENWGEAFRARGTDPAEFTQRYANLGSQRGVTRA